MLDPPIKRFAERHKYAGTDTIAVRDLGFVFSRQGSGSSQSNGSSSTLARTDTLQSFSSQPANHSQAITTSKRAPSPDHRRRDDGRSSDFGPPSKRQRPASPPRDRERDRWDGSRRRHETPSWEKERERDAPPARRFNKDDRVEDKGVTLPPVLSWFAGVLPTASSFDGEFVVFYFCVVH